MEESKKPQKCYLCDNSQAEIDRFPGRTRSYGVKCITCGEYDIGVMASMEIENQDWRYILSGITREAFERGNRLTITRDNVKTLLQSASIPKDSIEMIDRILLYVDRNAKTADSSVELLPEYYPIAYAKNNSEFNFLCEKAVELGYITSGGLKREYQLDINGWRQLAEIKKTKPDTNQVFIAMWFDEKTEKLRDALKAGVAAAGYEPIIVDERTFTGNIMNYVLGRIRESKFVIADFTVDREKQSELKNGDEPPGKIPKGTRGGVYYEAGFAKGLGLQVIHTCKDDNICKNRIHFDVEQENTIFWKDEDLKSIEVRSYEERDKNNSRQNFSENIFDWILNIYGRRKL